MPLPDPVTLTEAEKAGGAFVIARLVGQIQQYAAVVRRTGDMRMGELRAYACEVALIPPRQADAMSRGELQERIYHCMVGDQSPPPPVPDDNVSVDIPPETAE